MICMCKNARALNSLQIAYLFFIVRIDMLLARFISGSDKLSWIIQEDLSHKVIGTRNFEYWESIQCMSIRYRYV